MLGNALQQFALQEREHRPAFAPVDLLRDGNKVTDQIHDGGLARGISVAVEPDHADLAIA